MEKFLKGKNIGKYMGISIKDVNIASISPMMQHYVKTKEEYKDCILFYRLGDFYEMFFEDAEIVSKELELTLTGKDVRTCAYVRNTFSCGRGLFKPFNQQRI